MAPCFPKAASHTVIPSDWKPPHAAGVYVCVRVCVFVRAARGLNTDNLARCHKCITFPIWQMIMSTSWRAEPLLQPSRCPSTPAAAFAITIDLKMWGNWGGRGAQFIVCSIILRPLWHSAEGFRPFFGSGPADLCKTRAQREELAL